MRRGMRRACIEPNVEDVEARAQGFALVSRWFRAGFALVSRWFRAGFALVSRGFAPVSRRFRAGFARFRAGFARFRAVSPMCYHMVSQGIARYRKGFTWYRRSYLTVETGYMRTEGVMAVLGGRSRRRRGALALPLGSREAGQGERGAGVTRVWKWHKP